MWYAICFYYCEPDTAEGFCVFCIYLGKYTNDLILLHSNLNIVSLLYLYADLFNISGVSHNFIIYIKLFNKACLISVLFVI